MSKNNNNKSAASTASASPVTAGSEWREPSVLMRPVVLPDPEVQSTPRRRVFTSEYKQRIVAEAEACRGSGQIASLLRREGLYSSHLTDWRKQLVQPSTRRGPKPIDAALATQIEANRKLRNENARLERRLERAEIVIEIQKKVSMLLGIPLEQPRSEGRD